MNMDALTLLLIIQTLHMMMAQRVGYGVVTLTVCVCVYIYVHTMNGLLWSLEVKGH